MTEAFENSRNRLSDEASSSFSGKPTGPHPANQAARLSKLGDKALWSALRALGPDTAADVFCRLDDSRQDRLSKTRDSREVVDLLSRLDADDRTDLIQRLDASTRERLLGLMDAQDRAEFEALAAYSEHSVGSVMSTEVAAVPGHIAVSNAINLIRLLLPPREALHRIFVIDSHSRLMGSVSLRDLLLADPDRRIEELMKRDVISARATEDRETAVERVREYGLTLLPVVDGQGALLGVVTVDDVLDVQEKEATEDFQKLVSVRAVRSGLRSAGFRALYLARLPWLLVLILVNVFSGEGIALFQGAIQHTVALLFFLPLLIATSGNAGAQSATLMVRALSTGEVELSDWVWLLVREIGVAALLGLTTGLAVWGIGWWRGGPEVAGIVAVTMVCMVVTGCLLGLCLPVLLTRLRVDPAAASVPLLTSLADISGVLIYLSLATWWLGL